MIGHDPHDRPSTVEAENGTVFMDGPGHVAVSLTPEAALETSERLLHAGLRAHGRNM
jgi:hypothetical protein